jgi:hypothetical protein
VVNIPLYYPIEVVAWNSKWQGIVLGLDNPCADYWGAIKYQNLAQLTATTTGTETSVTPSSPDYTTVGILAVLAVIVVGGLVYYMGRRGKKTS